MKTSLLVLSLSLLTQFAHATEMRPGAQNIKTYECNSVRMNTSGVGVRLFVTTQALAPQYNIRAVSIGTKRFGSTVPETVTPLKQIEQTAYNATFKSKGLEAQIDKSPMRAIVKTGSFEYNCK